MKKINRDEAKKDAIQLFLKYPWLEDKDNHSIKCCFCKGKYRVADRFIFKINSTVYRIRQCTVDDLMYLFPQPGKKYLDSLYNHPSYFQGTDDMYGLLVSDEKSTQIAKIRVDEILKYKKNPESILEIGCAYGHILIEAKNAGFKRADGIEFSKEAVKICQQKGLNVYLSSSDFSYPANIKKNKYDVIAMYSILEHVSNPLVFIKKVAASLARDGIIVIRVPEMNPAGPWLSMVDHTWHFTKPSIKKLLQRVNTKALDIFPSGKFKGIQHQGEMPSMTIIAQKD